MMEKGQVNERVGFSRSVLKRRRYRGKMSKSRLVKLRLK